jgi:hypothetical protein
MIHTGISTDFVKDIYSKIIPSDFIPKVYLELNPDVSNANEDPIYHYLNYGIIENRIYNYSQIPYGFTLDYYIDWINKKNSNVIYDIPFSGFFPSLLKPTIQSNKYNFLYYLSAIGEPNLEIKLNTLKINLNYLYNNIQDSFDIMINCYDSETNIIEQFCSQFGFLKNIIIHKKKGRLVELWKTNPYHCLIPNYDYILYIMDDIMISKLDMNEFISVKNKYNISFLSPQVVGSTWDYMRNQKDNVVAFANSAEIFCLLFNKDDFAKFMEINDVENTHTWGIDFLLGHFKIKTAIYYKFIVNHILPSKTDSEFARKEMDSYFRKHGFNDLQHVLNTFPTIYSSVEV